MMFAIPGVELGGHIGRALRRSNGWTTALQSTKVDGGETGMLFKTLTGPTIALVGHVLGWQTPD